jgi:hypothetical protein
MTRGSGTDPTDRPQDAANSHWPPHAASAGTHSWALRACGAFIRRPAHPHLRRQLPGPGCRHGAGGLHRTRGGSDPADQDRRNPRCRHDGADLPATPPALMCCRNRRSCGSWPWIGTTRGPVRQGLICESAVTTRDQIALSQQRSGRHRRGTGLKSPLESCEVWLASVGFAGQAAGLW